MADRVDAYKKTIVLMIDLYCRDHRHKAVKNDGSCCTGCQKIKEYSIIKLDNCPFGGSKPVCSKCSVHCYKPDMRKKIREIMRYAGPRMLFEHPTIAIKHFYQKLRSKKPKNTIITGL